MSALSNIDRGAIAVWRRNADVFFKTWKTNFMPSVLEPLLYLVAMGFGFSAFISTIPYGGRDFSYIAFLAPGLVAISAMYGGFFECTYGSFVRMHYQKTFDAITSTPVSLEDVVAGEVLWGATKSLFNATIVLIVIEIAGATFIPSIFFTVPTILLLPLISFICGLMFSSIAMIFTAWVPNIDAFNYPFYLLVTPMFLFGGTFFPISALGSLEIIAYVLPLTHASILIHDMSYGIFTWLDVIAIVYIIAITLATFIPAMKMMRKRLIR